MMYYYDVHKAVKIATNVEGFFPKYFETHTLNDVDLEIIQGNFEFDKGAHKKIGLFYGDDKTLYFESTFYGKTVYKVMIKDLNGKTKLYFTKTTNRIFNMQKLAFTIFQIKLLQRGYTLLHAGAMSKNKKGSILVGWPGVGKSSTIFGLVENESFKLLGDDSVILSKEGEVYSYPQRVGIYLKSKHFKNLNLSPKEAGELLFRYYTSKLPPFNRYIGAKILVDISDIAEFDTKVKIDEFYFLEIGSGKSSIKKSDAINKMIASTLQSLFDHYLSNKMFYSYCYITGFDSGYIEKNMRKILSNAVKRNPVVLKSDKKDFHKYFI